MTADANKAESLLCMDKARDAIRLGDFSKAERLLNKAKKLDPNQDISFLMRKVQSGSSAHQSSTESGDRSYAHDDHYEEHTSNLRSRKAQSSSQQETRKKSVPRASPAGQANGNAHRSKSGERLTLGVHYTQEQVTLVERIRKCKDYYEILNVSKTADESEIKKEYRKMALQLHPDKCRAPHATEAFKALGNAYAVLSDKTKRQQYDAYGAEGASGMERRGHRRGDYFEYDYGRGFEADITPEEIFNMFFGGGLHEGFRGRRAQHFRQEHYEQERHETALGPLLQLAPLIFILLLGVLSNFMVGDPAFSLNQNGKYNVRRETRDLHVPYFVKSDFEQSYKNRIQQVEQQVEDEYVQHLRLNCYKEQNQKETMKYRARLYHDAELFKKAESLPMPNCQRLNTLYGP